MARPYTCASNCRGQKWWRYDYKIPKGVRVGFCEVMSPPDDLDRLSPAGLKGLVVEQWQQIVELGTPAMREDTEPG